MIVKLLTEHHLEFLSLKGGCRRSSESTLVKMSNCWKFHAAGQKKIDFIKFVNVKCLPWTKTKREYQIFGNFRNFRFITIFDNFLSFAKLGRPTSTLFLPFLGQYCAQTKMQQHIDFPMEISVIKISSLANLMKNPLS